MGAFIRCRNFNPRSYKRSDFSIALARCSSFISIHAPTRGATDSIGFIVLFSRISIHAPTRGATKRFLGLILYRTDFNPRSYKRSDDFLHLVIDKDFISIHAPTRGATALSISSLVLCTISIHAPTRGATGFYG